ncbi:MAG TPA: hypothetical protein VFM96_15685 [Gaiellaceae bacterium]|nr:hypothetical protein [Gaiellaceae bacterium]
MNAHAQPRPSQVVAGYLAALSIFACLIGLAWHPLRLIGPGILLAMISAGMTGRQSRLSLVAVYVAAACFFLGMTIAIVTGRPLW